MKMQDTVTIAEFGPYRIKAVYDYRIEVPYTNKHDEPDIKDLCVDKIELKVEEIYLNLDRTDKTRVPIWRTFRTITLLDIPPWLWELLNSSAMLKELDLPDTVASQSQSQSQSEETQDVSSD